jgi:adenine-specific DNA-methyltransferase
VIKYLGSKRLLLGEICDAVGDAGVVTDLFSGTSRVGHALKSRGVRVRANDHNAYAATLAGCYVAADADRVRDAADRLVAELDVLPGEPGWFTETYCERSRFFRPENGARVDAVRERIAEMDLDPELEAIALTSLMEAADRVDSTTGLQMAYLKSWAPRAASPLHLRLPDILPGPGEAHRMDAEQAAAELDADAVYIDPPYNQHSYLGNYHVWESLAVWDKPEVYGVACKRTDVRERKSAFNRKAGIAPALERVIEAVRAPRIVVSFSDEGWMSRPQLEQMLAKRGRVTVREIPYRRYVGARIGIHDPSGVKVGHVSHVTNTEYLFVADGR